jgi:hypothetical protein
MLGNPFRYGKPLASPATEGRPELLASLMAFHSARCKSPPNIKIQRPWAEIRCKCLVILPALILSASRTRSSGTPLALA